jgi:TolB-like protein/tRNA A-37 threonylcarbamoyl transferase component Bud32/Tfp pilus assembly protein PilF
MPPMDRSFTGQTISHYRICEPVGEGGMGVVYRAEDPRLSRQVAVKVLRERFADDDEALRRFLAEARAACALNHPRICTVYDVGQHEGQPYLVMELVRGQTLDKVLAGGPLPVAELLSLAIQLADALAAAHAAGVVHCDIKPGNLMVTDHGLKVLDFGVARALRADTAAMTTTMARAADQVPVPQTVTGTLPYMSPEQVRGEPLDARTDVFSCGATLYEMATGQRAFAGGSVELIVDAVVRRQPVPAAEINAVLPRALDAILQKALEKDRSRRYQHMSELHTDLTRLRRDLDAPSAVMPTPERAGRSGARLAGRIRRASLLAGGAVLLALAVWVGPRLLLEPHSHRVGSIAVLPIANATGDHELEYLSDGLTMRLINILADVPGLHVKSRAAVFRYKGRSDDPQSLGRELQVDALLTGTITRRGDRLIVDAELVESGTGNQFWGRQFDHLPSEVFALEDDIARAIAAELTLELAPESDRRFSRRHTENIQAYQLYLRGAYQASTFRKEGLQRAIQYYQEALSIEPRYALAHSGMAHALFWLTDWYAPSQEVSPPALEAARRALDIDETLADAHAVQGLVTLVYAWDWPAAERAFQRALELNPADARTRAYYAWLLTALRRRDEGVAQAIQAQQTDSLSSEAVTVAALALYLARRFDLAEQYSRQVLMADPGYTWAHIVLGRTLGATGRGADAVPVVEGARQLEPTLSEAVAAVGEAYARTGRTAEALAALATLHQLTATQYVSPLDVATVHAGLGDVRQSLDWLERAYDRRCYLMPFIDDLPFFDRLDREPRFQALLARLGLPAPTIPATP